MIDAPPPGQISLDTLIRRLREGRYVVPDFQREFEWEPWDIQYLMRSIFLDYYIGSILLWKGTEKNYKALSCEPVYGFDGGQGQPEHIVLDGQQRLTAMHYAFLTPDRPLPNRANRAFYSVRVDRFMDGDYDEAFRYDWASRRFQALLDDEEAQFRGHVFPLGLLGAKKPFTLSNWLQGYQAYWLKRVSELEDDADVEGTKEALAVATHSAENAEAFGQRVQDLIGQYQISYIELDREIGIDKVCDIFTQINSTGVRLDVFDLMNALLKPKGLQLKYLWRKAAPRLEFAGTSKMNVYILQVMSILRQAYCSPKYLYFLLPEAEKPVRRPDGSRSTEILVSTAEDFGRLWDEAVVALEKAIAMLRHPHEFGAVSARFIPYPSILPVFAALQASARSAPENLRLTAQRKVRKWYWSSVFMNRYSGSVESTSARDFLDVRAWISDDAAEPAVVQEFKDRFKNLDLRAERRGGTSIYNGVFNLLVLNGARDWVSGTIPTPEDLDDHHIVPASWGRDNLDGDIVHSILNRTPLTAESNREVIRDRLPNVYLREMIENVGQEQAAEVLSSHFVSPAATEILLRDPFTPADYDAFVAERQRTIQDAIERLLIKERLDLSPRLRDLDEAIEAVELRLRSLIAAKLDDSVDGLPQHIRDKVTGRVESAARKNPALDEERYSTLSGVLEHADLRELQDTITNKALWSLFEPAFRSKENLGVKFDQLATLRNGIRHSRTVSNVERMEGQAAVEWFGDVL